MQVRMADAAESDLDVHVMRAGRAALERKRHQRRLGDFRGIAEGSSHGKLRIKDRSEEHTSELQSLMRISYAVFCLKKKKQIHKQNMKHTISSNKEQDTKQRMLATQ